jgi:hypothetical protein
MAECHRGSYREAPFVREQRAPRAKKRISCEILLDDSRYSGIVLDLSATGLWVQTSAKFVRATATNDTGVAVTLNLSVPGKDQNVTIRALVKRKKFVPPQFLGFDHGGLGLEVIDPTPEFFDLVAEIAPDQAEAVEVERAKWTKRRAKGNASSAEAAAATRTDGEAKEPTPAKRFRIHVVETTSGMKKTYLVSCASEEEASAQVVEQLGDAWQLLFIERV